MNGPLRLFQRFGSTIDSNEFADNIQEWWQESRFGFQNHVQRIERDGRYLGTEPHRVIQVQELGLRKQQVAWQWAFDYWCYTGHRTKSIVPHLVQVWKRFPFLRLSPVVFYDLCHGPRPKYHEENSYSCYRNQDWAEFHTLFQGHILLENDFTPNKTSTTGLGLPSSSLTAVKPKDPSPNQTPTTQPGLSGLSGLPPTAATVAFESNAPALNAVNTREPGLGPPMAGSMAFEAFCKPARWSGDRDKGDTCVLLTCSGQLKEETVRALIRRHPELYRKWPLRDILLQLWRSKHPSPNLCWKSIEYLLFLMEQHQTSEAEWRDMSLTWQDYVSVLTSDRLYALQKTDGLPAAFRIRLLAKQTAIKELAKCFEQFVKQSVKQKSLDPLRLLLSPDRPSLQYQCYIKSEEEAAEHLPMLVPVYPKKPNLIPPENKFFLPPPITSSKRTLVVGLEETLASLSMDSMYNASAVLKEMAFKSADIIHYPASFTNNRPIPVTPPVFFALADVEAVAKAADQVDGDWHLPEEIFPIWIRPGARSFLEKASEHFELVLWSRRSEHKTNTALHLIDPDYKLFPRSHRFYFENHNPAPIAALNRDLTNIVILDYYHPQHTWKPDVPENHVKIKDIELPEAITALRKQTFGEKEIVVPPLKPIADREFERIWNDILQPLSKTPGDVRGLLPKLLPKPPPL